MLTERITLPIMALCLLAFCVSTRVTAQDYKGFKVGSYQGQVHNKTGGNTGKGTLEIRSIAPNGTVQAHLRDSDGLEGEGTLAGAIKTNGVMQLSGTMTSPSNGSRWQSALIAVINNGQLRMGNKLTLGNTVEDETATMAYTPTTAPVRANTTQSMKALTGIGAAYGSRNPRTCANTKAPASGPLSAQQAMQYFICRTEGEFMEMLSLVSDVKLEIGKGRPFQSGSDRFPEVDVTSPVYPIRGSFTGYSVGRLSTDQSNRGKNCYVTFNPNATGQCYRTTFGDWKCNMNDWSKSRFDQYHVAPPQ